MLEEDLLQTARAQFRIVGPQITEEAILRVVTGSFPGKEDLVQFYLQNNGGGRSRERCLFLCGNPAHRVTRDQLQKIRIEAFLVIFPNPDERLLPFRSMTKYHTSQLGTYAEFQEMMAFLQTHIPIAYDHTGNDCWIDTRSGCIDYILWDSWREGPVPLAPSFRDFLAKFWNVTIDDPDMSAWQ